ncbi:MAG: Proton/glutamate-aspartate symporter [Chlamydiales bacterium]|nr:Proton/glutamate-aspartate symporter [Chlamydiales bacterium]
MKRYVGNLLLLAGIGLGLLTGWANIGALNETASVTSELFLRLLKLIGVPIIFLAVTSTITGMKSLHEMKRMGRKVLLYTLGTTLVSAAVALLLYVTINPAAAAMGMKGTAATDAPQQASYLSFVINIIPSNFFEAFAQGNVMGIVFIAMILSVSILFLPTEQKTFLNQFFSSLFAAMLKITGFVIKLMPIAIWGFMVLLVKELQENHAHFNRIMLYVICVVSANLIQGFLVLPLFLKMKKVSPWRSFRGMGQALTVAFFSKSSSATLPVSIQCAEKNLGIKQKVSSFSFPLCSVINMNGCAAFILTTVLFVSSANGLTFSGFDLFSWIFIATFAAIGNAGVPMGCFFLSSAFLIGMDVPLYMMGLILPFYAVLDMIETALNIWSDACITIAVDKDLSKADAPVTDPVDEIEEVA